ncbi:MULTISPECIES: hypothetical protein [unclassified Streptomyces]|uniref:hypothetical protein n=1 Tax=unclassified Streptomyces TaxID=2593676 RepID=UPI00109E36C0|nr:hypothetical protein [Streptomyces sp. A1136]THA50397.1 hypothetical protein E6R62_25620 [Streptomyces sp. A1136]
MYEMRAEPSTELGRLLWHVIAKDTTLSTLCGSLLSPDRAPLPAAEPASDHYCAACMHAVRAQGEAVTEDRA